MKPNKERYFRHLEHIHRELDSSGFVIQISLVQPWSFNSSEATKVPSSYEADSRNQS